MVETGTNAGRKHSAAFEYSLPDQHRDTEHDNASRPRPASWARRIPQAEQSSGKAQMQRPSKKLRRVSTHAVSVHGDARASGGAVL